jgi:hypothetical protein
MHARRGVAARCGTFTVPENRALANGRTISLRLAVVAARDGGTKPDPLVHITGGPGGSAIAAFAAFEYAEALLPLGLSFAAGAMLYVVVDELIPESHIRGNEQIASTALLGGFALMMYLDNAFG